MNNYAVQMTLAEAIYGPVVLAKDLTTGAFVAIKQLHLASMAKQESAYEGRQVQEDNAMERAVYAAFARAGGHINVLNLLAEFEEAGSRHMVLEFCPAGELFNVVVDSPAGRFDLARAAHSFRHIVRGAAFMHACGFAHRDISLENILVDAHGTCKLIDFGLATPIAAKSTDSVGKLFYMAPEVYQCRAYDPAAADMWSLGIVLFILLVGSPPVESTSVDDDRFRIVHKQGIRGLIALWKIESLFSPPALEVLDGLLTVDPARRLSMAGLLKHLFLQDKIIAAPSAVEEPKSNSKWLDKIFPNRGLKSC
ncbi:Aste57867_9334 [Aphanomyces stellatus]|uniref:Aste57867_9334 protein n=1 Tax=Aphanomyces stellatus TaxID=120398 RepID=A0A485KMM2_9STRA|nr:hypothetical protein As57867_009298 [Aphanomyces stellatus]VFT86216.1 Aste57867_9334 [Aphanomyces stellatus]